MADDLSEFTTATDPENAVDNGEEKPFVEKVVEKDIDGENLSNLEKFIEESAALEESNRGYSEELGDDVAAGEPVSEALGLDAVEGKLDSEDQPAESPMCVDAGGNDDNAITDEKCEEQESMEVEMTPVEDCSAPGEINGDEDGGDDMGMEAEAIEENGDHAADMKQGDSDAVGYLSDLVGLDVVDSQASGEAAASVDDATGNINEMDAVDEKAFEQQSENVPEESEEVAVENIEQAESSAVAVENIEQAESSAVAVENIEQTESSAVENIEQAEGSAVENIEQAENSAVENIEQAENSAVENIEQTESSAVAVENIEQTESSAEGVKQDEAESGETEDVGAEESSAKVEEDANIAEVGEAEEEDQVKPNVGESEDRIDEMESSSIVDQTKSTESRLDGSLAEENQEVELVDSQNSGENVPTDVTPEDKSDDEGDSKSGNKEMIINPKTEQLEEESNDVKQKVNHVTKKDDPEVEVTNYKAGSNTLKKEKSDADGNTSTAMNNDTPKSASAPKAGKQQECIVCKKVTKCKYNIVRNGDTKHLCDDNCFKVFRAKPTTFLQSDPNKVSSTSSSAASVVCDNCSTAITGNCKASFKVGKDLKKFCRKACMDQFKKNLKICAGCGKDLKNDANAFLAPIDGEGFKDFCGHACLVKYEHSKKKGEGDIEIIEAPVASGPKQKAASHTMSKCSVCAKTSNIKHEVNYNGKLHKLCSDSCFSAFRIANKLAMNTGKCENCNANWSVDNPHTQSIQFEGETKRFCTIGCLNAFKLKKQRVIPCTWCQARKSNFDMIERLDANNKFQLFCTLNCLSLYRVNLQANSNQSVMCDQCHKYAPAQYHLTMSDASVRNFCGYNCVMSFQGKFVQPSAATATQPTPSQQVTQNAAHAQSSSSTPAAATPKASPYGTRHSTRGATSKQTPSQTPTTSTTGTSAAGTTAMPVISNIVSLAPPDEESQASNASTSSSAVTQTPGPPQVIVQPPPPKQVKNKALLCKPYMQTKATSCRPHTVAKCTQTDDDWEPKKFMLPCPIPMMVPAPMAMYSTPTPFPILLPIPIPVPCFIPTTKKSANGIMKKIKELQERMPSDPFEAEILMMAEAVANAGRASDSETDVSDNEDNDPGPMPGAIPMHISQGPNSGELAEDMLQMALRMANEMPSEEPVLDLEDSVDPAPIRAREPPPPVVMPEFGTIAADTDILQASHNITPSRGRARGGKRRGGGSGGGGRGGGRGGGGGAGSAAKRSRIEEDRQAANTVSAMISQQQPAAPPAPPEPPADANFILKFTYGVNAYKHWVLQKNAQIDQQVAANRGLPIRGLRPFKLDVLQSTADELNYALCLFVKEVRKPNGEEYAPDSIFYLCLGIQEYLYENGRIDNIFTDFFYERFTDGLNEVLSRYEVRLNAQGMLVCRIEEEHLWESKQLGAHSPHVLLNTLIYFNTKHFMLRTPQEHLNLSFSHIMKHWKKTNSPSGKPGRSVYLRYYSPSVAGGGDAAQKRKKDDLPVFEQAENADNPLRCPVKLYEFYLSKCPESIKNRNDVFYLVPERSCVPDSPVWYSTQSINIDSMTRMLNRLRVVREIQEAHLTTMNPYYG